MNIFSSLDSVFPCGADRTFGEVVAVEIRVVCDGVDLETIDSKRKAWYVNASVNAFHMHRTLVRDFVELIRDIDLSDKQIKRAKRLINLAVAQSYCWNRLTDEQGFTYVLNIGTPPHGSVRMFSDFVRSSGYALFPPEIQDNFNFSLAGNIEGLVWCVKHVLSSREKARLAEIRKLMISGE